MPFSRDVDRRLRISRLGRAGGMALILASTVCAIAQVDAAPNSGPLMVSEFIYEAAPFPACHASTIEETPEGLVAAWFGGTHERHPDVTIWTSRKTGDGWTSPAEVADGLVGDERFPTWNPVLFEPDDGPLLLFYKVGPTPRDWWGMLIRSSDHGRSWSKPERLPDGILGPIKNKPVQLSSGRLLCPSSSEDQGWQVHFEFTDDLGKTWDRTQPVNDPENIRAIQPSILHHDSNTLQAIGRTRASGMFQVWSRNGGRDWGEMSQLGLPNPSSGTDAVTLSDGRQLLVYNHSDTYKVRSPLNVAVSDDGIHWDAALVLEDDFEAPAGFSYPAVIQTSDGLVHITYTWRRERIKHVVIDPSRLETSPIVDGKWPADLEGTP